MKKIIAWIVAAVLLTGIIVLLVKISPRHIDLTLQDTTDGTTTELRIEGWTWNSLTRYTESLEFVWTPQIKAAMTMTPYPGGQTDEAWTMDLMTILAAPEQNEIVMTYMGYDVPTNSMTGGDVLITRGDSDWQLWIEDGGEVISPIFTFQTAEFEHFLED